MLRSASRCAGWPIGIGVALALMISSSLAVLLIAETHRDPLVNDVILDQEHIARTGLRFLDGNIAEDRLTLHVPGMCFMRQRSVHIARERAWVHRLDEEACTTLSRALRREQIP